MSKWDKLNKKFDDVLDSLTPSDWVKWDSERDGNSVIRKRELSDKSIPQKYLITLQHNEVHYRFDIHPYNQFYYDDEYQKCNFKNINPEISRGCFFYVKSQYERDCTKSIL